MRTRKPSTRTRRRRRLHPRARLMLAGLLLTAAVSATVVGCLSQKETAPEEPTTQEITTQESASSPQSQQPKETQPLHDTPDTTPLDFPFNAMSMDWGGEDLDGWWHYELPEDYTRTGGYLPDLVQIYTYCLCKQNDVPYSMVLAMIEVESGYRWDVVSTEGAVGYLQIIPRYHAHRLPSGSGESALINPYANIRIGIEYLAELMERFDNMNFILSAYQYGVSGAYKNAREDGGSAYSDRVQEIQDRIETQLSERAAEQTARHTEGGDADE